MANPIILKKFWSSVDNPVIYDYSMDNPRCFVLPRFVSLLHSNIPHEMRDLNMRLSLRQHNEREDPLFD